MDVPLGFKFLPEPYECIEYLRNKVMGCPLPCDGVIFDKKNPYNLEDLPDIFSDIEKKGDLYLFTKLSRKGKTGSKNINRMVGKGTWHNSQNGDVRDHKRKLIGKATVMNYKEEGSINDMRYLMTEYTLLKNTSLPYDPLKNYVLCHLYKSPRWKNRQKKHNSSNQEPAVIQAPSPAPTESISSVMELELEMPTDLPSTSASNALYVDEPLAMETAYSQPSDETEFDPDILNILLSNDFDIDSWFNDPSLNDCFELNNTDPFDFSEIESFPLC